MNQIIDEYINNFVHTECKKNTNIGKDELTTSIVNSLEEMKYINASTEELRELTLNIISNFIRRGVPNPALLSQKYNKSLNILLFNTQAGWFQSFGKMIDELEFQASIYTLYGESDFLLLLWCSPDVAVSIHDRFNSRDVDIQHISIKSLPLYYGIPTDVLYTIPNDIDETLISSKILNYNSNESQTTHDELENSGIIIGSTWQNKHHEIFGVTAFIGIISNAHRLHPGIEVLGLLQRDSTIGACIVHFFEVEKGSPFQYIVKVNCSDFRELDIFTNYVSAMRIARTKFEGVTFLVAQEKEFMPTLEKQSISERSEFPDLTYIQDSALSILPRCGNNAIQIFNEFNIERQLILLRTFIEIFNYIDGDNEWDEVRGKQLNAAVANFAHSCMNKSGDMRLEGSVMEIATTVEDYLKFTLRRLADHIYNKDYSKAQKELKLPTKDFRKMTLGKTVNAFREIKAHDDFSFIREDIDEEALEKLEAFTKNRNRWAHGVMTGDLPEVYLIDEARKCYVEGIWLLNWIGGTIISKIINMSPDSVRIEDNKKRRADIFLSFSYLDEDVATRVANGIRTFDFPIWFSLWSLKPGDSIVEKIGKALSKSNVIVVLLSQNSVNSRWVKHELNTALMSHLSGHKVRVIPVLIDQCEVPPQLGGLLHIDMASDFTAGLLELLNHLKNEYSS